MTQSALPVVLVIASGRGERFLASGGQTHKLKADLLGKTVLQRTLEAVATSGLQLHLEDAGHPGMGDTIAAAVRATAGASGWLVLPADLPLVRPDTLQRVAAALQHHATVVPVHEGQRGHPVGFSLDCREALLALAGDKGASPVLKAFAPCLMDVNDPGCITDIDTVDDLRRARVLLQGRSS